MFERVRAMFELVGSQTAFEHLQARSSVFEHVMESVLELRIVSCVQDL